MDRVLNLLLSLTLGLYATPGASDEYPMGGDHSAGVLFSSPTLLPGQPGNYSIQLGAAQYGFAGEIVTGAPYSANAITETVQMLADGNRIRHTVNARIYRDAEGRTRREQSLSMIGPWRTSDAESEIIFIYDPVAQLTIVLNPTLRTAQILPSLPTAAVSLAGGADYVAEIEVPHGTTGTPTGDYILAAPATISMPGAYIHSIPAPVDLGEQVMDGVRATGTRVQLVIPAGAIGNDLPIEVLTERWFSPALELLILSRHSDPRFGEVTYRLTNIVQQEQESSLFRIPDDYSVHERMELPLTE